MLLEISSTNGGYDLDGELDLASGEHLVALLLAARRDDESILLNFAGVRFMDSSGLRALLEVARAMNGDGRLIIDRPTQQVRKVFDLSLPDGAPGMEVRG